MRTLEGASCAAIAMLATTTCFSAARAQTQSGAAEPNETSGKVEYDPSYFMAYEVQNADDMLRRIPGVAPIIAGIGSAVQTRGFGSGGDQILINGRRVPGKSNEISKILARINVRSVQRIELIRGVSKDIDVQSSGLVVNIVLRAGEKVAGGGNFELNLRGGDRRLLGPDGLVNYSSSVGRLAFNLGIERNLTSLPGSNDQRFDDRTRIERYFYLDGTLQEDRVQDWRRDHNKWIYTGGLTYDFDGGARAQLNGFYQTIDITETDVTDFVQFNRAGNEQLRAQDFHERTLAPIVVWEVSGEFISRLAGGNLAVMFISNRRDQDTIDFRNRLGVGPSVIELSRSEAASKQSEDIIRAQYGFDLTSKFNLEVGGEGARNTLRQTLQPYFDLDRDGEVEPVMLPFGAADVVEWRGEAFVNSRWTPFPAGTINASLNFEHSKLTTNSVLNPGRSLSFWKPRIDARLDTSKR
ncbi:MAG: TonB-dependent receptor plug domain-containing protein, partial [Novosphingobium sp.]